MRWIFGDKFVRVQKVVNRVKVISKLQNLPCSYNGLFCMDLLWGQGSRENRGKIPRNLSKDNKKARRSGLPIWRYLVVSS